jgi:hypothetical protein
MEEETGPETEDLAQEYLDEDPSVLPKDSLKAIQNHYKLTDDELSNIIKGMTNARQHLDPREITR